MDNIASTSSSNHWKISPLNSRTGVGIINSQRQKRKVRRKNKKRDTNYSVRHVVQCKSNTLKKDRCRKRTAKTRKCWIHLGKEDNLRIKKSNIPNSGEGLFSFKKMFRTDKKLAKYTGQKMSKKDIDRKYGKNKTAPYALCNTQKLSKNTKCIDAYKTTDSPARYANDGRKSQRTINAVFDNKFNFYSTKRIPPNTEILTDYGSDYWGGI